ncbi:BTB/POZ domain-containing protein [Aspergillus fijiensis CBS 313.89]|uniref:BTB domain-containing protein n=1 Tax=Aspergillus fijiensis CBS 313.89 TaxID=1448319 RepID=A0A8G1RRS8_9EURO|nr:uncharacterized protein BO72DRAFT_468469 [Aspergillus fijiensis CBS 313.89]RAK77502.1 hypothetical protein BO72DRAFT_468469 [Aspergillus fijiensis CBS 313.89]
MASKSVRVPKDSVNKFQGRTIEIVVGDEQKIYNVHEGLVRASSPFFEKALAGEWKESAQRTIQLRDDEPEIVALYIHWLYCGKLAVCCGEPGRIPNSEYLDLVKAYVLGDKILDTLFQDAIVDAIVESRRSTGQDETSSYPFGEALEYAYNRLAETAPILELFVDMYVSDAHSSWLHKIADSTTVPQPFLLRLASKLLDRCDASWDPLKACNYHTHGKNPTKLPSTDS